MTTSNSFIGEPTAGSWKVAENGWIDAWDGDRGWRTKVRSGSAASGSYGTAAIGANQVKFQCLDGMKVALDREVAPPSSGERKAGWAMGSW